MGCGMAEELGDIFEELRALRSKLGVPFIQLAAAAIDLHLDDPNLVIEFKHGQLLGLVDDIEDYVSDTPADDGTSHLNT